MAGLEIAAALLGVITVALVVRRSTWNYPFGIAMVSLYFFVFWQAKLYSDAILQVFFLVVQAYGWWAWAHAERSDDGVVVGWMKPWDRLVWALAALAGILLLGSGMARLTDAAAPFPDAAIAGLSLAAQLLQSFRRVESWILWIMVDVLAVGLFASRGLMVTSALYLLFLVLAAIGLFEWRRQAKA